LNLNKLLHILLSVSRELTLFALFFFSIALVVSVIFISRKFGEVTAEQIIFHLNLTLRDGAPDLIRIFIIKCIILPFMAAAFLYLGISSFRYKLKLRFLPLIIGIFKNAHSKVYRFRYILALGMFVVSLFYSYNILDVKSLLDYVDKDAKYSSFYENNYVTPDLSSDIFPNKKRNLIVIFVEGFEASFAMRGEPFSGDLLKQNVLSEKNDTSSDNLPYIFGDNLIPSMYKLAFDNGSVNFSNSKGFGGGIQVGGTGFSMGGLVSYICGIPLRIPVRAQSLDGLKSFLPNATCLSDILKNNSYNQSFIMGHNKEFSGMGAFLKTHNISNILDYDHYRSDTRMLPSNYHVGWGFEDKKVFKFAKEELNELSQAKKPFALYMVTLDTHIPYFIDKAVCALNNQSSRFKASINCADQQLSNFIKWVQHQNFYKDTTIVLLGDHLHSVTTPYRTAISEGRVFNLILNSQITVSNSRNRKFTHFDFFPTILESLGATLNHHRAALGTSLWSGKNTLLEKYISNHENFNNDMMANSRVYDKFLYGEHN
jgi:phosphoglycerol transferase